MTYSKRTVVLLCSICCLAYQIASSQDSVDVTFRYTPPSNLSAVYLVGEFNAWAQIWPMTHVGNNTFVRTARLRVGGYPGGGVAGAYQYKFFTGASPWPNDPLNHHINTSANSNSVLYVSDPTIYQLVPNERSAIVKESNPEISAYLFPAIGHGIDASTISVSIDGKTYSGLQQYYDPGNQQLKFRIPDALSNGVHKIALKAGASSDSTTFLVQAGFVQITSLGNFITRKPSRTIYGSVADTSIHSVRISRNETDTVTLAVNTGLFSGQVQFVEGANTLKAIVRDAAGLMQVSEPVTFTYLANHAPDADIYLISAGSNIILRAQGSTDPDSGQTDRLKFAWKAEADNPRPTPGVTGSTDPLISIPRPSVPGSYFFTLIAEDPDGNRDTTQNYFTVLPDSTVETSSFSSSPLWARQGRLYELFFKSLTPQGTISAAMPYLPYLKSLGINIIWVMPVMENAAPIDNGSGTGYNIKNFFKVAPEYGTNGDFKEFVRQAHTLGLKVILDVTPNHTSYLHPFVVEASQFREHSAYWDFYQHAQITNPNYHPNLSESPTAEGFVCYDGCNQLLNYNWSDIDARSYMIEVYKWWVKEFAIDGYRFDVYWGPHRRAGGGAGNELEMGNPVRKALKKIKPDILLLAEDDATGVGTEVIFADRNGGVDAGYDWSLYGGAIKSFAFDAGAIENLHTRLYNNNFYPGLHSLFLRFLENHDEERIVVAYGGYQKTMPVATTLFTMPGLPMIYSGQEVGFGLGITDYDRRRRGVIDWLAAGRNLLLSHYQRLAAIRGQLASLWSQKIVRLSSGNTSVYAYVRPGVGGDAVVAVNFSSEPQQLQLDLSTQLFESATLDGKQYFLNDAYNDTSYSLSFQNGLGSLMLHLPPYGSAICVKSDSVRRFSVPPLVSVEKNRATTIATGFLLEQNYPNPFNSQTAISYQLPAPSGVEGSAASWVNLRVFDLLGREVATLVNGIRASGTHTVQWNAGFLPSGMYVCRLTIGNGFNGSDKQFVQSRKMLLTK